MIVTPKASGVSFQTHVADIAPQNTMYPRRLSLWCLLLLFFHAHLGQAQLPGYSFRKQLTIDDSKVSGTADLIDFPALISITDTDLRTILNGGDVTSDNGYDIAFTAADGVTELDHDLESFDGTTGTYLAWVKIPTLSYNTGTNIYIYYGNASVTTDPSSTGTWDSNYLGVWHLDEIGAGVAGEYLDASGNGNHGKGGDGAALQIPTQATSKISDGQDFDGTDDWIKIAEPTLGNAVTVSAWVKHSSLGAVRRRYLNLGNDVQIRHDGANGPDQLHFGIRDDLGTTHALRVNNHLNTTDWFYIVGTWDGTTQRLYSNGSELTSSTPGITLGAIAGNTTISQGSEAMAGLIDEARVSDIARSADWIATEYTNQNDPANFLLAAGTGPEEPTSTPGNVSSNLVIWLKADAGVVDPPGATAWADQSGLSNTATAVNTPILTDDALNFNPGIEFVTGDNDHFTLDPTLLPLGNSTRTYFVVSTAGAAGNQQPTFSHGSNNTSERVALYHSTDTVAVRLNGGAKVYTVSIPSLLAMHAYDGGTVNDGFRVHLNGQEQSTGSGGITLNTTTNAAYVGLNVTGAQPYNGKIHEIIAYDRDLTVTAGDAEKVQSYLALKYGITLDNSMGNYQASNGTVIWNATDNSGYHNDIAGIGRDDDSGLDQQKSLSSNTGAMVIMDKGGSFSVDNSYIVWGNDAASATMADTDTPPGYFERLQRVWKASVTGTPGTVTVRVIYSNNGQSSDYALHVDADGTFASGATDYVAQSISGDTITFANVTFNHGDFFTLGKAAISPGGVDDDLTLWLKADAGTNTTTDGGAILTWEDQSGKGFDATGTNDAKYLASFSNGNPAVRFTNDDQPVEGSISRTNGTGSTIFVAGTIDDVNEKAIAEFGTAANQAFFFDEKYAGANNSYALQINLVSVWTVSDPGGTTNATIYENGENIHTQAKTENTNWTTAGTYYLGDSRAGGDKLTGDLAEIIYYDTQLSAAERQKVESYLAIKYGVTLNYSGAGTEGDYVSASGTTLWDASDNSGYHNDVAGIGRDDQTELDQRQSTSANADAIITMDKGAAFTDDDSFVFWGNNNGATTMDATPANVHPDYDEILTRKWKVGVGGTPSTVSVSIELTNNGGVSNYALHVDADGTFTDGNSTNYPATSISGNTITFTNVTFADGDFFTVGFAQRAPGGISDQVVLWLRADAGVEEALNDAAEADDAVNRWVDQSGARTNDAVNSAPPTFRDNATNNVNYNPVVEFDGVNDGLNFGNDYIYSSGTGAEDGLTFFAIVKPDLTTSKSEQYIFQFGTYNSGYTGGLSDDAGRLYNNSRQSYINSSVGYGPDNDSPVLIRYTWDFDDLHQTIHLYGETTAIDDRTHTTTQYTAAQIDEDATHQQGSGPFTIGRQAYNQNITTNNGRYLQGDILEVIGYNRDLLPWEYRRVEGYLAIKYGITLDNTGGGQAGDLRASDGTIIWDAEDNAAYHNHVIGIGRDDDTGLFQKQSKTEDDSLKIYVGSLSTTNSANTGHITNARSYITVGHDGGRQLGGADPAPWPVITRFDRVWKVINTNFTDDFSMAIEWEESGPFDINDILFLVDEDGDFSDCTVFEPGDFGLSFTEGSIIVSGISTSHIPANSIRYVTVASGSKGTTLPIELLSFEALADEAQHSVQLQWTTASETDNDYFTIEKSRDGTNWTAALVVHGAGNSSEVIDYAAVDTDPFPGLSYYRLKQTDFDGGYSHSDVASVILGEFDDELSFYPNPSEDIITLLGPSTDLQNFRVIDLVGKDVTAAVRAIEEGVGRRQLDISLLPKGLYTIKTPSGSLKLIKN